MLPTYHMKDQKQAQTLNDMWHLHLKLTGHTPKLDDLKMTITRAQRHLRLRVQSIVSP